ncbi:MAG: S1/P1 nuclease, partial [Chromatiaceae bacterium]
KSLGYPDDPQLAADKLAKLQATAVQRWQSGQPLVWAQQSLEQTRRIYREYKPGMLFSQKELDRDGPVIEQRLLQASVRLAWQLDQLLQPATGN